MHQGYKPTSKVGRVWPGYTGSHWLFGGPLLACVPEIVGWVERQRNPSICGTGEKSDGLRLRLNLSYILIT